MGVSVKNALIARSLHVKWYCDATNDNTSAADSKNFSFTT